MPDSIPYQPWGDDGWVYYYTVTFAETRGISATIEWLERVYMDRNGEGWSSEWDGHRESISIPGGGSNSYDSWVRGDINPDLRGGTVRVDYSGHDANGYSFSGRVSATLAWPTPTP
jgi:hypothetical protein